jgi:hypothetical protein
MMRVWLAAFAATGGCVAPPAELPEPCGDGVLGAAEACDDGVNDGAYGGCLPGCGGRAAFCGDGAVDEGEACDDGINDGAWGSCAPDCAAEAGRCGDGEVGGPELCDDGVNDGRYGGCEAGCLESAERCGDGEINGPEGCDDGFNDGRCGSCTEDCAEAVTAPFLTRITVRAAEGFGFPTDLQPDLYLEVYDAEGALLAVTLTVTDTNPPVEFAFDGLRADEGALRVVVWDEDGGAFGDPDQLGVFRFDPAGGGGSASDGGTRISWTVASLVCD